MTFLKTIYQLDSKGLFQISLLRPPVGVLQSSILSPFFFLIYNSDLPNELKPNTNLFADDTVLFTIVKDKNDPLLILK